MTTLVHSVSAAAAERRGPILVIGYGNTLRGDDAAGRWVAEAAAALGIPGVAALSLHQLGPELAAELAQARAAIFVDADLGGAGGVQVRPVEPLGAARPALGHSGSPAWLLALAEQLYGRRPPAWLVAVPAQQVGLGEGLSERTLGACRAALLEVRHLIARVGDS